MYRLLLVDDEAEILDWLFELFQGVPGMELDVYRALSGLEALDILERTKVDVILSDIRMPGLTGLQLMDRVRNRWPQCRFVFLTGYSDFDSIYTAMQAQGVSYLLKTEEDERIVDAVSRALAELERSTRNQEMQRRLDDYLAAMLPYRQAEYLGLLVQDAQQGAAVTQEALEELRLGLRRNAPLHLAVARFDDAAAAGAPRTATRTALSLRLRAEELLSMGFESVCALHTAGVDALWLLQGKDEAGNDAGRLLGGLLESLQDFCRQGLGFTVSLAYWSQPVDWTGLWDTFWRLRSLLGAAGGITAEMLLNEHNFLPAPAAGAACAAASWRQMDAALDRGDIEAFLRVLSHVTAILRAQSNPDSPLAQETYYRCATALLSLINRRHGGDASAIPAAERLLRAGDHADWNAAADYLLAMGTALFRLQRNTQVKNVHESVERIMAYIRAHLGEDLSLLHLSEQFYFNPSYLSRLFKQAAGQNITDYITALRVERAQQLLKDPRRRVGDVAAALGFESQHYFARFFKKATGLTPQEYRERSNSGG